MLTVGIILGPIDFRVAALFAKFLQRLAAHAKMIFHLRDARTSGVPFLLEFPLADFQAQLFAAQAFELHGELFALPGEGGRLVAYGSHLLLKRGFAAPELGALFVQSSSESFCGHEPLIHRGGGMRALRALSTLPRFFHVLADARGLVREEGGFKAGAGQFTLLLAVGG